MAEESLKNVTATKFCRDCKWVKPLEFGLTRWGWTNARCLNPEVHRASYDYPVAGNAALPQSAGNVRLFGPCGKDGKLWEAR